MMLVFLPVITAGLVYVPATNDVRPLQLPQHALREHFRVAPTSAVLNALALSDAPLTHFAQVFNVVCLFLPLNG